MTTALDSNDNHICGNCYLRSSRLMICLLTGEEITLRHTCKEWFDDKKIPKTEL
jgi:hypothetical protein